MHNVLRRLNIGFPPDRYAVYTVIKTKPARHSSYPVCPLLKALKTKRHYTKVVLRNGEVAPKISVFLEAALEEQRATQNMLRS